MANLIDVAKYILESKGPMSAMKLQKLMYYSQAWSLVWDEEPLFSENFQAWANGPVIPELFAIHRGKFKVDADLFMNGDINHITTPQKETIDLVLESYSHLTGQQLSRQSHSESPWMDARKGLDPLESSTHIISHAAMDLFYSSL